MSVDFSTLATPKMIEEIDFETLLAERKSAFLALWDDEKRPALEATLVRESEPLTKLLEESCYREMILRNRINQAALSTLLAFATSTDLDAVVANYGITRLLISPADEDSDAVYESDDALRYRASLVFDSLSVAGPTSAYEFHALSSDGRVGDAKALSPAPAEALIIILQNDTATGLASQALIDIVYAYLSDETRRPVADRITVQSVEPIDFVINATVYTTNLPESDPLITEATAKVTAYIEESQRIGRSIYLSKLYELLHVTGVTRVSIESPTADIIITNTQVASCSSVTVTAGSI